VDIIILLGRSRLWFSVSCDKVQQREGETQKQIAKNAIEDTAIPLRARF
jgi:hypothetical protein